MGGASSAVEKDEDGSVVTISEDVARRLLGKSDLPASPPSSEEKLEDSIATSPIPSSKQDRLDLLELYQDRVKTLERQTRGLQDIHNENFEKAVKEVEGKFIKPPASYPVCVDLQAAVQRCYQENPTTTLNCAPQVRAFRECVEKQRETLLARKG